jgi:hypothetical protein
MTVICGLNGVGKTTLLRLVEGALGSTVDVANRMRTDLVAEGEFAVRLVRDADDQMLHLGDGNASAAVVIDACEACGWILQITSQPNFEDLLEGIEPHEYSAEERRTAEYVVGKRYARLEVLEIEEPDVDDSILPFFRAIANGTEYDTRTMGLGELAALFTLWSLARTEPATVVLLEEPETFLSSHATVALLDVLAKTVDSRRLYAVVTTHSAGIVARAPLEALRLLMPSEHGVTIRAPQSQAELEHLLGSFVGQARIAIVEDRTAAVLTSELLGRFAGLWGQAVEVLPANGAAQVVALCRTLPRADQLRVVGILDGDQEVPGEGVWPVLTLPPPDNPDAMLRAAATHELNTFARALGRDLDTLNAALQPLEGLDEHDWFTRLAESLALDPAAVLRAAVDAWLEDPGNAEAGRRTVEYIVRELAS